MTNFRAGYVGFPCNFFKTIPSLSYKLDQTYPWNKNVALALQISLTLSIA